MQRLVVSNEVPSALGSSPIYRKNHYSFRNVSHHIFSFLLKSSKVAHYVLIPTYSCDAGWEQLCGSEWAGSSTLPPHLCSPCVCYMSWIPAASSTVVCWDVEEKVLTASTAFSDVVISPCRYWVAACLPVQREGTCPRSMYVPLIINGNMRVSLKRCLTQHKNNTT